VLSKIKSFISEKERSGSAALKKTHEE